MSHTILSSPRITVGLDLGDRYSQFCLLDEDGTVVEEGRLRTTVDALQRYFAARPPMRIVIEVGTHSPWISRLLKECGHEALVANARKVRLANLSAFELVTACLTAAHSKLSGSHDLMQPLAASALCHL